VSIKYPVRVVADHPSCGTADVLDACGDLLCESLWLADAHDIARRLNAYDGLVAACGRMVAYLASPPDDRELIECRHKLVSALAAAKGGPS
jgi:hypothetical protein